MTANEPNPIQNLLRRHMGIDAFALDGDETPVGESWQDKRREPERVQKISR